MSKEIKLGEVDGYLFANYEHFMTTYDVDGYLLRYEFDGVIYYIQPTELKFCNLLKGKVLKLKVYEKGTKHG